MIGDDYSINITDKQDDFPDPFADAVSQDKTNKTDKKASKKRAKDQDSSTQTAPPASSIKSQAEPQAEPQKTGAPDLIPSQSGKEAKPTSPMPDIFLSPSMPGMPPLMPPITPQTPPQSAEQPALPDTDEQAPPLPPADMPATSPDSAETQPGHADQNKRNIIAIGDRVNLNDLDPTMRQISAGLGWQFKGYEGEPIDLDVSVFLLNKDDLTREDSDFIFYNNEQGCDGAVTHDGDNRIGAGDGDDENIHFDMSAIPFDIVTIMFVISIYQGEDKDQDFSSVNSAYLRLFNEETSREICRINISESNLTGGTALKIAALERIGPKWEFHAMGEIIDGELKDIAERYGIVVGEY